MAKDRAKDKRRVPSLGIGSPISHVKIVKASDDPEMRKNANHQQTYLAEMRHSGEVYKASAKFDGTKEANDEVRAAGKTPVVKIKS
jgi:hypothetical protein